MLRADHHRAARPSQGKCDYSDLLNTATLTISVISCQYFHDSINAAVGITSTLIDAGTSNILDYATSLSQNANNSYCGT